MKRLTRNIATAFNCLLSHYAQFNGKYLNMLKLSAGKGSGIGGVREK